MQVLVLNQNFEPLNVCSLKRALVMVFCDKAEVLVRNHQQIQTVDQVIECPSVVRLRHMVRRPLPRVRLSRRGVFRRDSYTCQYCGQQVGRLTLEHVIPRHLGGGHTWENLVTACVRCNHRKGGRSLEESGMHLLRLPCQPKASPYYFLERYVENSPEEWRPFLPTHLQP